MRRRRPRPAVLLAAGFAVFVFLGISFLLARGLSGPGAERSKVLKVLQAQARGDSRAVLAQLDACRREPACATTAAQRTRRLRTSGAIQILNYEPSVQFSLTRQTGVARVAWRAGEQLPIVQCVRVRRDGPLTGGGVELLSISDPIGLEAGC